MEKKNKRIRKKERIEICFGLLNSFGSLLFSFFFCICIIVVGMVVLSFFKTEVPNPQRTICLKLCKPFTPEVLFSNFLDRKEYEELQKIGYIHRKSSFFLDLLEKNCFKKRTKKCKYILTGISKIGKSTLVTQKLKNQPFVLHLNFKSSNAYNRDLMILQEATGLIDMEMLDILNNLKQFTHDYNNTIIVLEDITKNDKEKETLPDYRADILDYIMTKFKVPFIITSSNTGIFYFIKEVRIADSFYSKIFLDVIDQNILENKFQSLIPNIEDRRKLFSYADGCWLDIKMLLYFFLNGNSINKSIDSNNKKLCSDIELERLSDEEKIILLENNGTYFIPKFDSLSTVLSKEEFLKAINSLHQKKFFGLKDEKMKITRRSLLIAIKSNHCKHLIEEAEKKIEEIKEKRRNIEEERRNIEEERKRIRKFSKEEVKNWIDSLENTNEWKNKENGGKFFENGVDGRSIHEVTVEDLKSWKILFGDRIIIINAIKNIFPSR